MCVCLCVCVCGCRCELCVKYNNILISYDDKGTHARAIILYTTSVGHVIIIIINIRECRVLERGQMGCELYRRISLYYYCLSTRFFSRKTSLTVGIYPQLLSYTYQMPCRKFFTARDPSNLGWTTKIDIHVDCQMSVQKVLKKLLNFSTI